MAEYILISAVDLNQCIGCGGKIPWHIPEDLKYFKAVTMGHTVVMGRKTASTVDYQLIGRDLVVLSEQQILPNNVKIARNKQDILDLTKDCEKVFIAGGKTVYDMFLRECDVILLTQIYASHDGDTFVHELNQFRLTKDFGYTLHDIQNSKNREYQYAFLEFHKRKN